MHGEESSLCDSLDLFRLSECLEFVQKHLVLLRKQNESINFLLDLSSKLNEVGLHAFLFSLLLGVLQFLGQSR